MSRGSRKESKEVEGKDEGRLQNQGQTIITSGFAAFESTYVNIIQVVSVLLEVL